MSRFDLTLEPERVARRIEVINGAGGRRRWSADDKARILEETLAPGAVVSEIARRHGLRPQQVFGWRREARIAPDEDGGECLAVRAGSGGGACASPRANHRGFATTGAAPPPRSTSSKCRNRA